ncbi:MAG: hypothetical protein CSYNP_03891 [Syntrophus sp. SKADARSKE-3]|nr:hypothetical protein [Syntrophus sp. SKADARSKE-3]
MNLSEIPRFIENKYFLLLTALILLIVMSPLIENARINLAINSGLFLAIITFMLIILGAGRLLFSFCLSAAIFSFILHYMASFVTKSTQLEVMATLAYLLFIGVATLFLIRKIFSEEKVTADTIMGSLSIYVLIGVLWQLLYSMIWLLNRDSFSLNQQIRSVPDFFYFSFTTMTTLGYGDILPISQAAKIAAMLQAMTGQIYLTVLVARLVGLHMTHSGKK